MRPNVFVYSALVKVSASWSRVGPHSGIDIYVEVLLAVVEHPRLALAHALRHVPGLGSVDSTPQALKLCLKSVRCGRTVERRTFTSMVQHIVSSFPGVCSRVLYALRI